MTILKLGSRGAAVKELQKLLKLYPDGIFGTNTEEAVRKYQEENNLTPDGIVGPATMAKLISNRSTLKKSKRKITEIIVHCTDTPEGRPHTVDDIRRWHKEKGWADIGYHYLVYLDGTVHEGRDVNVIGAHCNGHNTNSIGVCYVGGREKDSNNSKDTRTKEQKEGLVRLLRELRELYPTAKIYGHRDFSKSKPCPSFDALNEYKNI
jgi:N-acetylmuramoyl-L-alanine amidase